MHILQQNTFDIQCSSREFGKELHQHLGHLLETSFYPKLDLLFDKYDVKSHSWDIDEIEISLPNISKKNWKNDLVKHSLFQIEEYLQNIKPIIQSGTPVQQFEHGILIRNEQKATDLFFMFLKSGVLSQNSLSTQLDVVVKAIEVNDSFRINLLEEFSSNSQSLIRWIFTIPHFFKEKVIMSFSDFPIQLNNFLGEIIKNNPASSNETKLFFKKFLNGSRLITQWMELLQWAIFLYQKTISQQTTLFKSYINWSSEYWNISSLELKGFAVYIQSVEKNEVPQFSTLLNDFFYKLESCILSDNEEISVKITKTTDKKDEPTNNLIEKTYFIANAGLVILHPFLKPLFEQLNLCENEEWNNYNTQHKAVLLTQYLISGKVEIYENELVLNKILCGIPIETVINTKLRITKEEKEKCQSMLEAVLEYWKPMNSSLAGALRETFLQRAGKIDLSNPVSYELWVEEKGVDILLDQLPWGIGMIKTPWMDNYLHCHWN